MTGHKVSVTKVLLPSLRSQFAYVINVVERRAGPSGGKYSDRSSLFLAQKHTPLWATPRARERGTIDIEFRLSETACGDCSTWVRHLLQRSLGNEEVVNLIA